LEFQENGLVLMVLLMLLVLTDAVHILQAGNIPPSHPLPISTNAEAATGTGLRGKRNFFSMYDQNPFGYYGHHHNEQLEHDFGHHDFHHHH